MIKTGKIPNSVNPSATQKERSYSEIQIMKKLKFFTFVLAFLASVTASAQTNNPTFATNFVVGKQFIWERVTEVGTTSVTVRVIDEVAPPATARIRRRADRWASAIRSSSRRSSTPRPGSPCAKGA